MMIPDVLESNVVLQWVGDVSLGAFPVPFDDFSSLFQGACVYIM